jgi:hypothetical protein
MMVAIAAQVAFPGIMFQPAFGNSGEYVQAAGIVDPRPDAYLVECAEAADTQAAPVIHLADVDAGGGGHQMIM